MALHLVNNLAKARTCSPTSRAVSVAIMGRLSYVHVIFLLLCALSCAGWAHGREQGVANFTLRSDAFDCAVNMHCLGTAHTGQIWRNGQNGTKAPPGLSLVLERPELSGQSAGLAYYKDPIRLLDPSKKKAASFNTSFAMTGIMQAFNDSIHRKTGDGTTFVLSADKTVLGVPAKFLGIFDNEGSTPYRSIVVEYDAFQNRGFPAFDISHNHVSFDFTNITASAAANASDVGIFLWWNQTIYSWLEYRAETKQLELRISYETIRPTRPLLKYTVDLFDVAAEYMWAGFSAGTGDSYNHYYIQDWKFESYGISIPGEPAKWKKTVLIVTISAGVPVLLLALCGLGIIYWMRKVKHVKKWTLMDPANRSDDTLQLHHTPQSLSYKHLSIATGSFCEESKLGQGGFGSVYRGVLPASGTHVAVKKIKGDSLHGEKQFMAEISIISQLRHRNLIHLLGWCKDNVKSKYLLVYELMPNGSLDKVLFLPDPAENTEGSSMQPLSWKQRFNIVNGTAAALTYLHHSWKQQVIHRDIKASNIMLDQEWNAKLGDFGLARLVDHLNAAPTTVVAGTYGYIAPEAASGKFTDKTDVFAFGAVCLEIACGRKAFDIHRPAAEIVLVDWVWQRLSEGRLLSAVDKQLHGQYDIYWMEVVLMIGLLCSHPNPTARPSMRKVTQVFAGEVPAPSVPVSKPSAVFNTNIDEISIDDLQHIKWDLPPSPPKSGTQSQSSTFSEPNHIQHAYGFSSDDFSNP